MCPKGLCIAPYGGTYESVIRISALFNGLLHLLSWESKFNFFICQVLVHISKRLKFCLYIDDVLRVKEYIKLLCAVKLAPSALPNNLRRKDKILKNGILNRRKCARSRPRSLESHISLSWEWKWFCKRASAHHTFNDALFQGFVQRQELQ